MARNMVRLRTSIQSDPEDLPLIQNANCCFVVPWDPEKKSRFFDAKNILNILDGFSILDGYPPHVSWILVVGSSNWTHITHI